MDAITFTRTRTAAAVGGLAVALAAGQAFGAAFALQENSGSGLGNAFAGGAASAEDVSTIWANPAGMSRFATPQIAATLESRSTRAARDADVPLEWLGIDRPFAPADVRALDAALALPEVSR
jgi:long-subunit fatty acid transport protein